MSADPEAAAAQAAQSEAPHAQAPHAQASQSQAPPPPQFGYALEVVSHTGDEGDERIAEFCDLVLWSSQWLPTLSRCEVIGVSGPRFSEPKDSKSVVRTSTRPHRSLHAAHAAPLHTNRAQARAGPIPLRR